MSTNKAERTIEEALSDADFGKNDGGFDNGRPERNIKQFIDYLRDKGFEICDHERSAAAAPPHIEKIVADMPWPASCRYCSLVTEDPDGYFRPNEYDDDAIPNAVACPTAPDGVHEPRTLDDYGRDRPMTDTRHALQEVVDQLDDYGPNGPGFARAIEHARIVLSAPPGDST